MTNQTMETVAVHAPVLFIHGGWHDQHSWDLVVDRLNEQGYLAEAMDLPGSGAAAGQVPSFRTRPLDRAAFATEGSPSQGVTQDERTQAVIARGEALVARTGRKVVLVGHSLGGVTVTAVAEARPDLVAAAVYLAGSLLPPGMTVFELNGHETKAEAQARGAGVLMADPGVVGALRLDAASEDPEYLGTLREIFYNDLSDEQFAGALKHVYPDEPMAGFLAASPMTRERFGTVPRHYIHTAKDQSVPPAAQRFLVQQTDLAMGNAAQTHTVDSGHSPFYSQPDALTQILEAIVDGV